MLTSDYSPIESFHLKISLGMIGFPERVVYINNLAEVLEELRCKLTSVVGDQLDRRSIGNHKVVEELLRDIGSGESTKVYITYYL